MDFLKVTPALSFGCFYTLVLVLLLHSGFAFANEVQGWEPPPPPPVERNDVINQNNSAPLEEGVHGQVDQEAVPSASMANGPNGQKPEKKVTQVDDLFGFLEPFEYDGSGRRDPFKPYRAFEGVQQGDIKGPLLPLQRFILEEIRLAGIIWDVDEPTALFIDPKGQTHYVGINDRIGRNNGYVARIREGEVVVVETIRVRGEIVYNTKIIKLKN